MPYTTRKPVMAHAPPAGAEILPPRPSRQSPAKGSAARLDSRSPARGLASPPALLSQRTGKGSVYLLGFCLLNSYFRTYRDADLPARDQLCRLIEDLFRAANVRAHVHSSNPDIEASVRAGSTDGYLVIINHEAPNSRVESNWPTSHSRPGA